MHPFFKSKVIKLKPPYNDVIARHSEFGMQVKLMRKEYGITIKELSELTGLSTRTILRIEHGKPIRTDSLIRITEALRYEIDFIDIDLLDD